MLPARKEHKEFKDCRDRQVRQLLLLSCCCPDLSPRMLPAMLNLRPTKQKSTKVSVSSSNYTTARLFVCLIVLVLVLVLVPSTFIAIVGPTGNSGATGSTGKAINQSHIDPRYHHFLYYLSPPLSHTPTIASFYLRDELT